MGRSGEEKGGKERDEGWGGERSYEKKGKARERRDGAALEPAGLENGGLTMWRDRKQIKDTGTKRKGCN